MRRFFGAPSRPPAVLSSHRMDPQALRACALFQSLPADRVRRIADIATHRDLPAGAIIFREGESGDEMYVVIAGKVRISKRVAGVGEEALGILEPGSHFGEMAMVDDSPRSADAIAHTACALAVIRRDELDQLMFVDKDLAYETNDKIKGFFAMTGGFK